MFDTLRKSQYKVVSIGALASAVRPRIERSIEQALNADVDYAGSTFPTQGYNQENTHCMSST